MENVGHFFGNVSSHWIYLMGGIAGIVLGTVETVRKKPWNGGFWFLALMCLLASTERAWQDEHRNTEAVKAEKAALASAAFDCQQSEKIKAAYTLGLQTKALTTEQIVARQQAINDSQNTEIAGCLVSLGKMNPKIREQFAVVYVNFAS